MKKLLHDDELCHAGVFLQQLVQSDLAVALKVTNHHVDVKTAVTHSELQQDIDWSEWMCVQCVGGDLCPVELQFVVSDPPGLQGLLPLCSFLLHVVFLQPVRLNQLLKAQLTAQQTRHFITMKLPDS